MSIKEKLACSLNELLSTLDIKIVRNSEFNKFNMFFKPSHCEGKLPMGAEDYLQWTNPRLLELKRKYDVPTLTAEKIIFCDNG